MRAGVGQGITNAINNYDQGVEAGDAAEMRKVQMEQLKKAIAQQDAAALANLNDQAKASKVQEPVSWDDNGNPLDSTGAVIPIRSQQSQQGPQAPNPGQASVPNPANQPQRPPQQQPMQQGAMPPPQQQPQPNQMQQRPPMPQQAPQGQPMPPPQQPQMQAPPKPQIPPYVNPAQLQAKPPSAPQPQIGNGAPPAMGMPPNVQGLIGEAKQISQKEASMWDAYTKLISEPDKPTPIEKKLAYYQSQGLTTQQALKYKLNLSPDKYYEAVEKERTQQDVQKKTKLDAIDKMMNSRETERKDLSTEKHQESSDLETHRHNTVEESLANARLKLEREKNSAGVGPGNASGDAAKAQMIIDGAPKSQIVGGYGKSAASEYSRLQNIAVGNLMSTGMSAEDAGKALAHAQKTYKAEGSTETALTKRTAGIELGINEIKNDINTLMPILDKFGNKTPKFINTPLNVLKNQTSDPGLAQLQLASNLVATKYERALTGGLLSVAQLHSGAAEDAKKILNGDMSIAEMKAKIPLMQRELDNSLKAGKEAVGKLSGKSGSASSAAIPDGWSVKEH